MARFYPVYVRRSDGKLELYVKGKLKERNEPTPAQLDPSPDANGNSDFYKPLGPDEPKNLDWRRKIGSMLARELGWQKGNGEGQYILAAFPEGYRLYDHIKRSEKKAAGSERLDAYLYGHPTGKKKRFRSPADFFPHVLWLCTDETNDPNNCACKMCQHEDYDGLAGEAKKKTDKAKEKIVKPEPATAKVEPQPAPANKVEVLPEQPLGRVAVAIPRPLPAHHQPVPAPLPQPRTQEDQIDRQYGNFVYRPGEIVWFNRGQAWGLGVVVRRWATDPPKRNHYTVQPLSHPFEHPPAVRSSDYDMRPWLAWSVPRFSHEVLNELNANLKTMPNYETLDWHRMRSKMMGPGDMEMDGSILAAKGIDCSYTLNRRTNVTEAENGAFDTHYEEIFIGAESVKLTDPLRLQIGSGTDVLVLRDILERTRRSEVSATSAVWLVGDVYALVRMPHTNPNALTPAAPFNNPNLPPRMTDDLMYRNNRSIPANGTAAHWKIIAVERRVQLDDIKGRWYEASLLLPILDRARFEESTKKGDFQESGQWMNSRGDCMNNNRTVEKAKLPRINVRKETRRDALGAAVPRNCAIIEESAPPPTLPPQQQGSIHQGHHAQIDNLLGYAQAPQQRPQHHHQQQQHQQQHAGNNGNNGFDEFMNLEGF